MAVKVISLRSMTKTVCEALVETEAVLGSVLHWVCTFLCALWFRARTAGNLYLAMAAPTWDEDGCSQILHFGRSQAFDTLEGHREHQSALGLPVLSCALTS